MLFLSENMQPEGNLQLIAVITKQPDWCANGSHCLAKLRPRVAGNLSNRVRLPVAAANDPAQAHCNDAKGNADFQPVNAAEPDQ